MKTALVLGVGGTFGGHVARALAARGWHIRALVRDRAKVPAFARGYELVQGDVRDEEILRHAAEGAEIMVYGINPPYAEWDTTVVPWLDGAARVAEDQRMTLVFPGNVYIYNPLTQSEFDETAPIDPVSTKGKLRAAMEHRLRVASENGARVILVRAGDFIAGGARSAWITSIINKRKSKYVLRIPAPIDVKHTWAYAPDLADAVSQLIERREALPAYADYHFAGYHLSFREMADVIRRATGNPVELVSMPWGIMRLLKPLSGLVRGAFEMRYLWDQELRMNGHRLERALGQPVTSTPIAVALAQCHLI